MSWLLSWIRDANKYIDFMIWLHECACDCDTRGPTRRILPRKSRQHSGYKSRYHEQLKHDMWMYLLGRLPYS